MIGEKTFRIGQGWDIHALQPGPALIVGGVEISPDCHPVAHSDGDVLCHALMDALLGATGKGDLGGVYPDTDPEYEGAISLDLLCQLWTRLREEGWRIENLDSTVIFEKIRLVSYREAIKKNLVQVFGVGDSCVNIKFTRGEGQDAVGKGHAIVAQAIVLLSQ